MENKDVKHQTYSDQTHDLNVLLLCCEKKKKKEGEKLKGSLKAIEPKLELDN